MGKNKILISEVTKLLKAVLVIGSRAAISEIYIEAENLLMCTKNARRPLRDEIGCDRRRRSQMRKCPLQDESEKSAYIHV